MAKAGRQAAKSGDSGLQKWEGGRAKTGNPAGWHPVSADGCHGRGGEKYFPKGVKITIYHIKEPKCY